MKNALFSGFKPNHISIKIIRFFILAGVFFLAFSAETFAEEKTPVNEHVIILHGMGRTHRAMKKIEKHLENVGYQVTNLDYPSTQKPIEKIAEEDLGETVEKCLKKGATTIHFVTHSLGGIVLREYLQTKTVPGQCRAVMLAPPNNGSEIADFLKTNFLYQKIMGPAGQQLGTGPFSKPNTLKPVNIKIGIITGNKDSLPVFSFLFNGPNDGKVSVESAKLKEMADFIVLPCGHTFIMNNETVIEQIEYFLKNGAFKRSDK